MNNTTTTKESEQENTRFCASCGFKFKESEMKERKERVSFFSKETKIRWYCYRCSLA